MIRVFLVDDHALVRAGMAALLGDEPDIEVVGQASGGWQALRALGDLELQVDVVLLDISMPQLNGLEVLRKLRALRPSVAILAVSMYSEQEYGRAFQEEGAAGYLCKDETDKELLLAVRAIHSGRSYFSRKLSQRPEPTLPHHALSPRELQVFLLILDGRQTTDIAAELNLGISTVSTYLKSIREKLNVSGVAEIVRYAHRHGLVS
ncbi:MAG: hypothetical protein RIT28_1691 [Pseudomonadota bacterium]